MRAIYPLLVLVLAAGCGGANGEPDARPPAGSAARSPAGSPTPQTPEPPAETAEAVEGTTENVTGEADPWTTGVVERGSGNAGTATVVAVRIASHEGFDRLVIELAGDTIPGYRVERITPPARQCGSGDAVELEGAELLQLRLEPARAHTEEGESTLPERRWVVRLPVLREARLICDFEGQVEIVMGVTASTRYRIIELSGPARLVIDVSDD